MTSNPAFLQPYEIQAKGTTGPYRWMPITRNPETGQLRVATIYEKQGTPLTPQEASKLIRMCNANGAYFYRVQKKEQN